MQFETDKHLLFFWRQYRIVIRNPAFCRRQTFHMPDSAAVSAVDVNSNRRPVNNVKKVRNSLHLFISNATMKK